MRFELRCRLLPHVIPTAGAILVTGVSLDRLLDPTLPSHHDFICQCYAKLSEWSPATFIGYNSVRFDEPLLRQAFLWTHDDVMTLAWVAALAGHKGMSAAIRLAWGAMLSPVDVWTLPRSGWRTGASGTQLATQREKTSRRVLRAVGAETLEVVDAYLGSMPAMLPDTKLIRRHNGTPYRSKDTFGDDFRAIRAMAFPGDARQFLDLRRSALTEARLGGATKDDIGLAAANSVDRSAKLEETYLLGASERVLEARQLGRLKMAGRNE